ncbi:TetR/AcrR family transcriptional regulator [Deinococcus hohokamensis]|uniref:TetR/AcrR family transcriptional regulator n=1 Tax=Deinococcus hohokamensis TaxID=309883 RepID=A0ABV9I8R2_9DEIO
MPRAEPRKRLPSADRRRQILDMAAQLFVARGFEAVTMGDIAAALETSRPTIYTYFTSTESLLDALLDERLQTLLERVDPLLAALNPSLHDQAPTHALEAIFRLLLSERETMALLHSGGGPTVQTRRHGFLNALGQRITLNPELRVTANRTLLLIITTLLESLAYRAMISEPVELDRLATDVALFIRAGTQGVLNHHEGHDA